MTSVLGAEWHISASGNDIITENGSIKDKQKILQNALNSDIKEICSSVLSSELSKDKTSRIVLQVQKVRNISAPKANEDSQAAPRMLKLSLFDGETYVQAVELSNIASISRNNTPPGTKILVNCAKVVSGYLLLSPSNCTVLGGKVPALIEKWEIAKSVQRTNRRGLNDDGPPPWVNFGKRIQSGNQETNFKSLDNKNKESSKEHAEFEAQRQGAIAEANSGAVKKVFGGMVKQNVQPPQNRGPDRQREKKESFRGRNRADKDDILEAPMKPEKVSLFSFLENKLPACDSNDVVSKEEDIPFTRKTKIPKEFQKPKYDEVKYQTNTFPKTQKNKYSSSDYSGNVPISQQNPLENIGFFKNTMNKNLPQDNSKNQQKNQDYNSKDQPDKIQKKTYENRGNNNHRNQNESTALQKPHGNQGYNSHSIHKVPDTQNQSYNNRRHTNGTPDNQKFYETSENNLHTMNALYNSQNSNHTSHRTQPERIDSKNQNWNKNRNQSEYGKTSNRHNEIQLSSEKIQKPIISNNSDQMNLNQNKIFMDNLTQGMEKITMNSQFASRSLRQHLNLEGQKKSEENVKKSHENISHSWKIGDNCLAKYWEDGKFYDATVMAITDRTVVVKFKGYGNIEEILTNDCLPMNQRIHNINQGESNKRYEQNSKSYTGSMQFRRTPRNGYNN